MQQEITILPKGSLVNCYREMKFGYTTKDHQVIIFYGIFSSFDLYGSSIFYNPDTKELYSQKEYLKCVYNELYVLSKPYIIYVNGRSDNWNAYKLSLVKNNETAIGILVQGTLNDISGPPELVFRYINKKVYKPIRNLKSYRDVSFIYT